MRRDERARGPDVVERRRDHSQSIGSIGHVIDRRCIFVAGLPASGKSRVVGDLAATAAAAGHVVHTLQWDVARLPFDTPENLGRHPEVGGVTHPAIRLAVGAWCRGAVARWDREHPGDGHVLIGETPLVGERFMELARPRDDAAEALLASEATVFVIPVPSREVRRSIERSRASDMAGARDTTSAPPDLVDAHWHDLEQVALALGVTGATPGGAYDPDLYAATYRRLLAHRHVEVLQIDALTEATISPSRAMPIVPSAAEVREAMRAVERLSPAEIGRRANDWYRV